MESAPQSVVDRVRFRRICLQTAPCRWLACLRAADEKRRRPRWYTLYCGERPRGHAWALHSSPFRLLSDVRSRSKKPVGSGVEYGLPRRRGNVGVATEPCGPRRGDQERAGPDHSNLCNGIDLCPDAHGGGRAAGGGGGSTRRFLQGQRREGQRKSRGEGRCVHSEGRWHVLPDEQRRRGAHSGFDRERRGRFPDRPALRLCRQQPRLGHREWVDDTKDRRTGVGAVRCRSQIALGTIPAVRFAFPRQHDHRDDQVAERVRKPQAAPSG